MAITSNASRIQIQTAAKNGTLGSQGVLADNQILFDTNISTNNSNLESSPSFENRIVVLREGTGTQEVNVITSVDVDGVTCTCFHDWDSAPASVDEYHVGYNMDDVATVTGCTFDTTAQEFQFDRRLEVGQNAVTFALLGAVNYQTLRMSDEGLTEAITVTNGSRFQVGTEKAGITTKGATIIFTHNGNGEDCIEAQNGATFGAYDFTFISAYFASSGVTLDTSIIAGATLEWGEGKLVGVTDPGNRIRNTRKQLENFQAVEYFTKAELEASAMFSGHIQSEFDKAVFDAISGKPAGTKVYILIEDV